MAVVKARQTAPKGAKDRRALTNAEKIKVIEGAKRLLGAQGQRWVRGQWFSKDGGHGKYGNSVDPEEAVSWCVLGALEESAFRLGFSTERTESHRFSEMTSLHNLARSKTFFDWHGTEMPYASVDDFNDRENNDWKDVLAFLNERLKQLKKTIKK